RRLQISFLIAQKEKRGRTEDPNDVHDGVVTDEVGINHQGDAEKHRFPQVHSLSVNEGYEPDRTKNTAADQVRRAQIEHARQTSYLRATHCKVVVDRKSCAVTRFAANGFALV